MTMRLLRATVRLVLLVLVTTAGLASVTVRTAHAAAYDITEYSLPSGTSGVFDLAAGADGNMWFTELLGNRIGRITSTGAFKEFNVPTTSAEPRGITSGPDGNMWFTEAGANKIGRITPSGAIAEFSVPTPGSAPVEIAAGPDGNLWFTENSGNKIGRITTTGAVTEFALLGSGSTPTGITAGADGRLWFAQFGDVGAITTGGAVTEYATTSNANAIGVASGADGDVWFTENSTNKVGRVSPSGQVFELAIPTATSHPWGIAAGVDGNLWFVESSGHKVARLTVDGQILEFPIPTASSTAGIAAGPDGDLWFAEGSGNKIGRITPAIPISYTSVGDANGGPVALTADPAGSVWVGESGTDSACDGSTIQRITPGGASHVFAVKGCPGAMTTGSDGRVWFANGGFVSALSSSGELARFGSGSMPITDMVQGADLNVWFTETFSANAIGRITPSGAITQFPIPTSASDPESITLGSDGNVWFTEDAANKVGRITPGGAITEFPVPTSSSHPYGITTGPDGHVWFTEWSAARLGRVNADGSITEFPVADSGGKLTTGADGNLWYSTGFGLCRFVPGTGVETLFPTFGAGSGDAIPNDIAAGPDGNIWFTAADAGFGDHGQIGRAYIESSSALVLPGAVAPKARTTSVGGTVAWLFAAPGEHYVADSTALGLFDSGPQQPGAVYAETFPGAGKYSYTDGGHSAGTVSVPMSAVPAQGTTSTAFTITWSPRSAPSGYVFDVEVKRPGTSGYTTWRQGAVDGGAFFVPDHGTGTYSFKARVRRLSNGAASAYSPTKSVKVK